MGTYILALELVPARFTVMRVSLLGAALGLFFGISPVFMALATAIVAGAGTAGMSERSSSSAGGPLGLVMTLSLGLAFILFYKVDVNSIEAFNLFWGSVLALSEMDLYLTIGGALLILVLSALFFLEIRAVLYDRRRHYSTRPCRTIDAQGFQRNSDMGLRVRPRNELRRIHRRSFP